MAASTAEATWFMRRSLARFLRQATKARDPHSAAAFEQTFAKDGWASLRSIHEAPRYGVISAYARHLGARSVLDIGCGEGLLLGYLPSGIRYCGIDFSQTAIAAATASFQGAGSFAVADAEQYKAGEQYDLIVLNEVLYSLAQPGRVVRDCLQSLTPGGHVIVSCDMTPEKDKIWPIIAPYVQAVDTMDLHGGAGGRWSIRLMRPR